MFCGEPRMSSHQDGFRPAWWCQGPHAQTIWGSVLWPAATIPVDRERWETPDGDFLDLDHLPAAPGQPIAIVLHGFESSSKAKPVRGILHAAFRQGWRGIAPNFRSCSGEPNRLRRSYHGGDTADLGWVIAQVAARHPGDPISCIGISLGGNVLLKYLGEQGAALPSAVRAAVAISAPFDLAVSARRFERGFFNRVYMDRLVRSLKRKIAAKLARYPDLVDRNRLSGARTVAELDELVTAPVHGFPNAASYWAASSSKAFLASIRCPTLLINAADDPLVPAESLPVEAVSANPFLTTAVPSAGGHVGFLSGWWPGRPRAWAEQRAIAFCLAHLLKESMRFRLLDP